MRYPYTPRPPKHRPRPPPAPQALPSHPRETRLLSNKPPPSQTAYLFCQICNPTTREHNNAWQAMLSAERTSPFVKSNQKNGLSTDSTIFCRQEKRKQYSSTDSTIFCRKHCQLIVSVCQLGFQFSCTPPPAIDKADLHTIGLLRSSRSSSRQM